jgi:hypothetical protein
MTNGRAHFASAINWWLNRCDYSHAQIGALADWALAHDGWLISSQISHLRNNHVRQPSFINLEALGSVNEALDMWHAEGPRETFHRYGPFGNSLLSEELLDRGQCLRHPVTEEPLDFAGFCELFVGRTSQKLVETHRKGFASLGADRPCSVDVEVVHGVFSSWSSVESTWLVGFLPVGAVGCPPCVL